MGQSREAYQMLNRKQNVLFGRRNGVVDIHSALVTSSLPNLTSNQRHNINGTKLN